MTQKENISKNLTGYIDYHKLIGQIELLSDIYPNLHVGYIGATILDKAIPILTLGNPNAAKSVVYVGGIGAGDSVISAVLLRFVSDYFEFLQNGRRLYSVNLPYLFERRKIHIIPMLNCDGCTIRLNGCGENLLKDRLLAMNNGEESFSLWCSNARGVDLRRNFAYGFHNQRASDEIASEEAVPLNSDFGGRYGYCGTAPESEPETASLCNHLRMNRDPFLFLNLHTDTNSLTYPCKEPSETSIPRVRTVGRLLSRMSSTAIEKKAACTGSAEDWFTNEFHQPAFSLGCRYPDLENTADDSLKIYAYLREALFCAPLLV